MSIHLTIKNDNRPNLRTATPEKKGETVCGWKYGLTAAVKNLVKRDEANYGGARVVRNECLP